jgi:hypothetical protein
MNKVQKFRNFLDSKPELIGIFQEGQQEKAVVFRSQYRINDSDKEFLIVLDDSNYSQMLCKIMTLSNPAKKEKLLYLINDLNFKYKLIRYTLGDSGDVWVQIDYLASDETFSADIFMGAVVNAFNFIEDDYGKLMRIVWA